MIWNHVQSRWMHRGNHLNGEMTIPNIRGVTERTTHLYSARMQLPRRHQFFFRQELNVRMGQPAESIRKWLRDTELIFIRAIRNMEKRKKKGTGMEEWLKWEIRRKRRTKDMRQKRHRLLQPRHQTSLF